ncbi:hypothetical protein AB2R53_12270 [Acinetobacter baumannii]|uniref:Uncharacterized protein n=1 Tax=Acinetobacter baumannii TaxID=470 RepID=A0A241ZF33_ACIBA|nr:hypothetical protein [Acinetobacter baumannii]OTM89261.1 hypothetical protein B9X95_08080 [Acinetobacter baumannii]
MKPEQFIREFGLKKAREVVEGAPDGATYYVNEKSKIVVGLHGFYADGFCVGIHNPHTHIKISDLKRLVDSVDLVNNCGGLAIANKITFQKRLRNEKATHFIQHPENQKLIQLLGRNQRKPKEAIKFDLFEQAIRDHESIYGGGDE